MNILALISLIVAIVVFLSIFFYRKCGQKKRENYQWRKKAQNEELDKQLINPFGQERKGVYSPYQIKYMEGAEGEFEKKVPLFQLTENTERAVRKYLFQQRETVYIGMQNGNLAVFKTESEGESFCKINYKQNMYCVKAMGVAEVIVKRGKAKTNIDYKGIILKSKDKICLLGAEYTFQIIQ